MPSFEEGSGLFMKPLTRRRAITNNNNNNTTTNNTTNNTMSPNDIKIQPLNLLFGGSIVVPKNKPSSPRAGPRVINGQPAAGRASGRQEVIFVEVPDEPDSEASDQPKKKPEKKARHDRGGDSGKCKKSKTEPVICHLKKNKASVDLTDHEKTTPPITVMCIKKKSTERQHEKKAVVISSESESEATGYGASSAGETGDEASAPKTKPKTTKKNAKDCDGTCCEGKKAGKKGGATEQPPPETDTDGATAATGGGGATTEDAAAQTTEDASIRDKSEGTQTKGPSTATWTLSQDALIRSMKQGGETWASIGAAVGAGKKEVAKRWKELGAMAASGDEAAAEKENTAGHNTKTNQKGETGGEAKTAASPVPPPPPPSDPEAERAAQKTHIYTQVLATQYPSTLRPYSGGHGGHGGESSFWSERDVRVLGTLDSMHKVDRWLALQADFYNATGRMVSADVLRARVEEGEQ